MNVLIDAALIVGLGLAVGWAARRSRWPASVGLVLLGVVLGDSLLGWITPSAGLELLGQIGVVLLLGVAGLALGLRSLKAAGWPAVWVALLGIALSGGAGYLVGRATGAGTVEAVYTGLALTATSIGISVQALQQFGLIAHRVGRIIVAAAVVDDVVALFLLAAAHGAVAGGSEPLRAVCIVAVALPVLAGIALGGRLLARLVAGPAPRNRTVLLAAGIAGMLAAGWLTHALGYSAVVGAFFAGVGVGEALAPAERERLARRLEPFVWVLAPFFFVLIGAQARLDVLDDPGMWTVLAGLLLAAVLGKLAGGFLGAAGSDLRARLLVGLSMIPRGEVTMVIAGLGFAQRHLSHHVFVVLLVVAVVAAVAGPLLMTPLARRLSAEGERPREPGEGSQGRSRRRPR